MRVAIDARKLHDFGIGTYLRNLLTHLARLDQATEYVLLCRPQDRDFALGLGPNFRAVAERSPNYSIQEQIHVPWIVGRERPDVYHAPHYVLPVALRCRSVVTIHDCIHLRFPDSLPGRAARVYARAAMRRAAYGSARILTVSEASKLDILSYFPVPPEKIEVVYNAVDDRFWAAPSDDEVARVRQRLRIDAPFVLYVGNLKPHKNLERLLDAVERLWSSGVEDVGLLVVGGEVSTLQSLRRAVGDRRHQRVRFLGPVDAGALSVLYRLASVFAFPSLCEGFGLPPLEAMACGTPVVTSNVSSLPEVTGGAALLVDPYDVESIAAGLRSVLTDAALADRLRRQGIEQARTFSWERSAARTRQIYASVGGG